MTGDNKSSDVFEEAERRGFVKVKETETEMEAIQEVRRLNARIAENTCDIDGLGMNDDYFCASGGKR